MGKESACNAGATGDAVSILGSERSPGGKQWQPTPIFLPRESHGQKNLLGCSPWGHKESDMTERLSTYAQSCREAQVRRSTEFLS